MSDTKPVMAQENFASAGPPATFVPADFSNDVAALAYAEAQLGTLVEAMRYSLKKQITGWPDDDRELNTYEALRRCGRRAESADGGRDSPLPAG